MESRAWGATKKRTNLYVLKLHKGDYALLAITVGILVAAVYIHFYVPIPTIVHLLQHNSLAKTVGILNVGLNLNGISCAK